MRGICIHSSNIISALGNTTAENFNSILSGNSGITRQSDGTFSSAINPEVINELAPSESFSVYSRFEKLAILSISEALSESEISLGDSKTIFILSTTKGNIDLLKAKAKTQTSDLSLHTTAEKIAHYFKAGNRPLVVSTACISGLMALIVGQRLIRSGLYDHAVVCGADLLSDFVTKGFQSFMALSDSLCKPFDAARNGINLGEAAATVILTNDKQLTSKAGNIILAEGASSNDANHISGPSRTGEELALAINKVLQKSNIKPEDIGFISAHGTATIFNDEMEAKAFQLSEMVQTPVNSLKGYFGHTLGAAGLLETIISAEALKKDLVLPTKGWEVCGVSVPLRLSREIIDQSMQHFLKTSSGFGGCNAAMIFSKQN